MPTFGIYSQYLLPRQIEFFQNWLQIKSYRKHGNPSTGPMNSTPIFPKKVADFPPFQAFFKNTANCEKALCHKARTAFVWNSRFGDALRRTQEHLDSKNFYACNPSFDKGSGKTKNGWTATLKHLLADRFQSKISSPRGSTLKHQKRKDNFRFK